MARAGRRQHLVIFTRQPRIGVGKRRLAAQVGDVAAWRFQRWALAQLHRELGRDPRWTTWLGVTPDPAAHSARDAWMTGARRVGQGGGDLGARMTRIVGRLPPGAVVIIGSDAPQVRRPDIAAAFAALRRWGTVFGPALDGGYWLVGLAGRSRRAPPFEAVRWSTAHALADTLANLPAPPAPPLRTLEDVDDAASLRRCARGGHRPATSGD